MTGLSREMGTSGRSGASRMGADAARASRPSISMVFSACSAMRWSFCLRSPTSAAVTRPRWRLSSATSGRLGR